MSKFSESIGKKIVLARGQKKISQSELAKSINITQQCLSGYERGVRQIPLAIFVDICTTLNAPLSWFLPEIKQYGEIITEDDLEFLREVKKFTTPNSIIDFIRTINRQQSNGKKQRCFDVTKVSKIDVV